MRFSRILAMLLLAAIVALGIGWRVSVSRGAARAHRVRPSVLHAAPALAAGGGTCFVSASPAQPSGRWTVPSNPGGLGSCSETPCVVFVQTLSRSVPHGELTPSAGQKCPQGDRGPRSARVGLVLGQASPRP